MHSLTQKIGTKVLVVLMDRCIGAARAAVTDHGKRKMATLLECLRSLPGDMTMRDLAAVRDEVATVADHIERVHCDECGYEVRKESRNYGRNELTAVGLIGGPAMYREIR
ncbi:hypothetical protein [Burkholderia anthina]|uniref:hypothetical protein n=1 Tax=Burkholderia anthina TaxID=179879 RepID=UPI002930A4BC|nr:hypothetical protein [Burkholderia anthina]WJN72230.1 hypothetical protein OH687_39535 [Burkholderia anthina]